MRMKHVMSAVATLSLLAPIAAFAQTSTSAPTPMRKVDGPLVKAKAQLIDRNILDQNGKKIGEVEDLMADLDRARIPFVIVSLEGLTGTDDVYYTLPWGALTSTGGDDHVVVKGSTDALKASPSFKNKEWPAMTDPKWAGNVYKTFNMQPYWTTDSDLRRLYKVSDIIGYDVHNPQNETLGDVEELVLDSMDGDIAYAVLSFGGILGLGEKLFAIPPQALAMNPSEKEFVLNVDKDRLKNAPGFDKKHWPDMASADFASSVRGYYGYDGTTRTDAGTVTRAPAPGVRHDNDKAFGTTCTLMKAKDLIGLDVRNQQGENLGKIQDIVIDLNQGRVAYAVLSFGGFLGMGDKLFSLPPESLKFASDNKSVVLNVDKERLKSAPGFDKNNWPETSNRQWLVTVYEFYGVPPYWGPSPSPAER